MATLNIAMRINRAISGATTVNPNAHVIAEYIATGNNLTLRNALEVNLGGESIAFPFGGIPNGQVITRNFGPGQAVPATFTTTAKGLIGSGFSPGIQNVTITWTLLSGVELINTQ